MEFFKSSGDNVEVGEFERVVVEAAYDKGNSIPKFKDKIGEYGMYPLKSLGLEILQINVGKMCNQTCEHCHVDAGPSRKEIMTKETMNQCLAAIEQSKSIVTVDLTGGAPEMNPEFRWFVEEISKLGKRIIVRSNLTILVSNKKYRTYPQFFKDHRITVIASLPCYTASNTDKQRGKGVFSKSIEALKILNDIGFGQCNSGLELHLVFNPIGASLPGKQEVLQTDYKKILLETYGIVFNNLYTITNMPINRFLKYLIAAGKYQQYMEALVNSFNHSAISGVMCRNTLSIGWDGKLYDCDFNQMLELPVERKASQHISEFKQSSLEHRNIIVNQHCYGCTAGSGSSCQGTII